MPGTLRLSDFCERTTFLVSFVFPFSWKVQILNTSSTFQVIQGNILLLHDINCHFSSPSPLCVLPNYAVFDSTETYSWCQLFYISPKRISYSAIPNNLNISKLQRIFELIPHVYQEVRKICLFQELKIGWQSLYLNTCYLHTYYMGQHTLYFHPRIQQHVNV